MNWLFCLVGTGNIAGSGWTTVVVLPNSSTYFFSPKLQEDSYTNVQISPLLKTWAIPSVYVRDFFPCNFLLFGNGSVAPHCFGLWPHNCLLNLTRMWHSGIVSSGSPRLETIFIVETSHVHLYWDLESHLKLSLFSLFKKYVIIL